MLLMLLSLLFSLLHVILLVIFDLVIFDLVIFDLVIFDLVDFVTAGAYLVLARTYLADWT